MSRARRFVRALPACLASLLALTVAGGCGGGSPARPVETARRELPPANPEAVRKLVEADRVMERGGRGAEERAIALLEEALRLDPNLWEAHHDLGVIHRRRGELALSERHFDAARSIQPAAREPVLALAEVRRARGNRGGAASLLQTFARERPNDVQIRVALAALHREAGDYDDALEQAREALVREPSNVRALLEVARVYRARGQHDVAELVLRKALDLRPNDAAIHNDLGLLHLARGDTQAAFLEFARAVQIDPSYAPAHMNQASVLLRAGDYAGAKAEYDAVLRVRADDVDARVALAIALRGLGQHQDARRELERVLEARSSHPAALFNLAILRAEFLDERPQSRELFQRFLDTGAATSAQREVAERYLREIPAEPAPPAPPSRPRTRHGGGPAGGGTS
jgi:tetratricopeptide (TPR) repeat protein